MHCAFFLLSHIPEANAAIPRGSARAAIKVFPVQATPQMMPSKSPCTLPPMIEEKSVMTAEKNMAVEKNSRSANDRAKTKIKAVAQKEPFTERAPPLGNDFGNAEDMAKVTAGRQTA